MTLYDLYKLWYARGFSVDNQPRRWDSPSKQDRSRVIAGVKYTDGVLWPDLQAVLRTPSPDTSSVDFGGWNTAFISACNVLVQAVCLRLNSVDHKKFNSAPTINALTNRLTAISKAPSIVSIDATSSSSAPTSATTVHQPETAANLVIETESPPSGCYNS